MIDPYIGVRDAKVTELIVKLGFTKVAAQRWQNAARRYGFYTVHHFIELDDEKQLNIINFGVRSLEITWALRDYFDKHRKKVETKFEWESQVD